MAFKNLAITDSEKKEMSQPVSPQSDSSNEPKYPYGLCINLDESTLQKLGIKEMPSVGESLSFKVKVDVTTTSEFESQHGGISRTLGLQITDIDMSLKKEVDLDKLYDKKEKMVGKDGEPKSKSYNMVDQPDPEKINTKG